MPGEAISRSDIQKTQQELHESHGKVLGKIETLQGQLKDKSHRELLVSTYHEKLRDHIIQLRTLSYSTSVQLRSIGVEAMKRLLKLIDGEHQRFEKLNPQKSSEKADLITQARSFNEFLDAKMKNFSPLVSEEKERDKRFSALSHISKEVVKDMNLSYVGGIDKDWATGKVFMLLKNDPEQKPYEIEHVSGFSYQVILGKNITVTFSLKDDISTTLTSLDKELKRDWPLLQEDKKQQERESQIPKTIEAFRNLAKDFSGMQQFLNRPENKRIQNISFHSNNDFILTLKDDPSRKPYPLHLTEQNQLRIDGKTVSCSFSTTIEATMNNLFSALELSWEKEFKKILEDTQEEENRRVRRAVSKDLALFDQTKAEFDEKKTTLESDLQKAQQEISALSGKVKETQEAYRQYLQVKGVQKWARRAVYLIPGFGQALASYDVAKASGQYLSSSQEEQSEEDKKMMKALQDLDEANKKMTDLQQKIQNLKPDFEKAMSSKIQEYLKNLDRSADPQRITDLQKGLSLWGQGQDKESRNFFLKIVDQLSAQERLEKSPQAELKKMLFSVRDYFLGMPRGEEKIPLLAKLFEALRADESLTSFPALADKVEKNDPAMSTFIQELDGLSAHTLLPKADNSTRAFDADIFARQLKAKSERFHENNPSPLYRLQIIWDLIEGTEHANNPRVKEFHEKVKNLLQSGKVNNLYAAYLYDEFDPNAQEWLNAFRHGKATSAVQDGGLGSGGMDYETLLGRKTDRYGRGEKLQEGITRSSLILAKAKIFRARGTPEDLDEARKLLIELANSLIQEAKGERKDLMKDFHEEEIKKTEFEKARLSAYQELGSEKSRQGITLKIAKENIPESEQYLSDPDKIERCRKGLEAKGQNLDTIVEQSILASSNAIAEKSTETIVNQKLLALILKGTEFDIKNPTEKHKTQLEAIAILKDSYGIDGGAFNPSDETVAWINYIGEEVVVNAALMAISAGFANVARAGVQAGARAMLNAGARATFKGALKAGGKATAKWVAEEGALMFVEGAVFHETNAILHGIVKEGSLKTWAQQSLQEHGLGWVHSTVALGAIKAASGIYANSMGEWLNVKAAKLVEQGANRSAAMAGAMNYAFGVVAEVTGMQLSTVLTTFDPNVLEDPKAWKDAFTMVLALRAGGKFPHTEGIHKIAHEITSPLQARGQKVEGPGVKQGAPATKEIIDNSQILDVGGTQFRHGEVVRYEYASGQVVEGILIIPKGSEKVYFEVSLKNGSKQLLEFPAQELVKIQKRNWVEQGLPADHRTKSEGQKSSDWVEEVAAQAKEKGLPESKGELFGTAPAMITFGGQEFPVGQKVQYERTLPNGNTEWVYPEVVGKESGVLMLRDEYGRSFRVNEGEGAKIRPQSSESPQPLEERFSPKFLADLELMGRERDAALARGENPVEDHGPKAEPGGKDISPLPDTPLSPEAPPRSAKLGEGVKIGELPCKTGEEVWVNINGKPVVAEVYDVQRGDPEFGGATIDNITLRIQTPEGDHYFTREASSNDFTALKIDKGFSNDGKTIQPGVELETSDGQHYAYDPGPQHINPFEGISVSGSGSATLPPPSARNAPVANPSPAPEAVSVHTPKAPEKTRNEGPKTTDELDRMLGLPTAGDRYNEFKKQKGEEEAPTEAVIAAPAQIIEAVRSEPAPISQPTLREAAVSSPSEIKVGNRTFVIGEDVVLQSPDGNLNHFRRGKVVGVSSDGELQLELTQKGQKGVSHIDPEDLSRVVPVREAVSQPLREVAQGFVRGQRRDMNKTKNQKEAKDLARRLLGGERAKSHTDGAEPVSVPPARATETPPSLPKEVTKPEANPIPAPVPESSPVAPIAEAKPVAPVGAEAPVSKAPDSQTAIAGGEPPLPGRDTAGPSGERVAEPPAPATDRMVGTPDTRRTEKIGGGEDPFAGGPTKGEIARPGERDPGIRDRNEGTPETPDRRSARGGGPDVRVEPPGDRATPSPSEAEGGGPGRDLAGDSSRPEAAREPPAGEGTTRGPGEGIARPKPADGQITPPAPMEGGGKPDVTVEPGPRPAVAETAPPVSAQPVRPTDAARPEAPPATPAEPITPTPRPEPAAGEAAPSTPPEPARPADRARPEGAPPVPEGTVGAPGVRVEPETRTPPTGEAAPPREKIEEVEPPSVRPAGEEAAPPTGGNGPDVILAGVPERASGKVVPEAPKAPTQESTGKPEKEAKDEASREKETPVERAPEAAPREFEFAGAKLREGQVITYGIDANNKPLYGRVVRETPNGLLMLTEVSKTPDGKFQDRRGRFGNPSGSEVLVSQEMIRKMPDVREPLRQAGDHIGDAIKPADISSTTAEPNQSGERSVEGALSSKTSVEAKPSDKSMAEEAADRYFKAKAEEISPIEGFLGPEKTIAVAKPSGNKEVESRDRNREHINAHKGEKIPFGGRDFIVGQKMMYEQTKTDGAKEKVEVEVVRYSEGKKVNKLILRGVDGKSYEVNEKTVIKLSPLEAKTEPHFEAENKPEHKAPTSPESSPKAKIEYDTKWEGKEIPHTFTSGERKGQEAIVKVVGEGAKGNVQVREVKDGKFAGPTFALKLETVAERLAPQTETSPSEGSHFHPDAKTPPVEKAVSPEIANVQL